MTICPLTVTQTVPALPLPTLTLNATSRATAASNAPISSGASLPRRQVVDDPDAPYANASIPTSILTACSVSYKATTTSICHTTLSPLASPVIPITDCYQKVTFSTDHGYTLVSSSASRYGNISTTASVTVATLTSYYAAPWQYVYTGIPADIVDKVVCSTSAGVKGCTTTAEDWAPGTGYIKATNTISFVLGAPITGVRLLHSILDPFSVILERHGTPERLTWIHSPPKLLFIRPYQPSQCWKAKLPPCHCRQACQSSQVMLLRPSIEVRQVARQRRRAWRRWRRIRQPPAR